MSLLSICHVVNSVHIALCNMIIYALMFLVCQWGERWILVVYYYYIFVWIQYWRKTYLLDLYSYWKYFILVSFKRKKQNLCASCTVWLCCGRFGFQFVRLVSACYLVQPEGKVYLFVCLFLLSWFGVQRDANNVSKLLTQRLMF